MKASEAARLAGRDDVTVAGAQNISGRRAGAGMRIAIACSRFNGAVTERLLAGALSGLEGCGVERLGLTVVWVPGAFELPLAAQRLAASGAIDAVVCLGAVIRGETSHYELVAGQCAAGLQRVQLDSGVPVVFGVLTTEDAEQAFARAVRDDGDPSGGKGLDAARTAVEMVDLLRRLSPVDAPPVDAPPVDAPPVDAPPPSGVRRGDAGT